MIIIIIIIRSPNIAPAHLSMDLHTGASIPHDVHSNYILRDHSIKVMDRNTVPFRLTQNIRELFGEYGVNGSFKYTIGAYALV